MQLFINPAYMYIIINCRSCLNFLHVSRRDVDDSAKYILQIILYKTCRFRLISRHSLDFLTLGFTIVDMHTKSSDYFLSAIVLLALFANQALAEKISFVLPNSRNLL